MLSFQLFCSSERCFAWQAFSLSPRKGIQFILYCKAHLLVEPLMGLYAVKYATERCEYHTIVCYGDTLSASTLHTA